MLPEPLPPRDQLKALLRRRVQRAVAAMDACARGAEARSLCHRLGQSAVWQSARTLCLYAPLRDEPDLRPLWDQALAEGKTLALPRWDLRRGLYVAALVRDPATDLVPGRYGVPEPRPDQPVLPWEQIDCIVVPGIAFDRQGGRLGRGAGHYDRILGTLSAFRCGVAFTCQIVEAVPVEDHDAQMDAVVTATEWIACPQRPQQRP